MLTPKKEKKITVLLADDHPLVLEGIRSILDKTNDIEIVGEACNNDDIKKSISMLNPQILLLDLVMPNFSPVELEKWVRDNYPETITLVLTSHDRDNYLANMIEAGATGYLDKKLRATQLIFAIRRAAQGEVLFDKEQIKRAKRWRDKVTSKWESLTYREREVLQMLSEGANNNKIAINLGISINTVEKHLTNIFKKLEVTSRTEAIYWWVEKNYGFP